MDDSCAVCAESLEWVAYGPCGHRDVCSTCVVRLRFVLGDRRCCICKSDCTAVFVTKAMGDYTRVVADFSSFPSYPGEGKVGEFWYHEDTQAFFDDGDHYKMVRAMCRLSCSVCDNSAEEQAGPMAKRRNKFKSIEQLKGHLFHQHRLFMCSLCLEGRKVFICEQKLYTRSQLNQHVKSGDSEVDGTEIERNGFSGHPLCEFCKSPFYGDNELYIHMSTEHYTCHICQRQHPGQYDYFRNYDDLEMHFRQEHFLCEDEVCLAKKFIVFQNEAEFKRHNALEHGGHMSRSQRNAALQIPTSFRYRRSEQEGRRGRGGRGRSFVPDEANFASEARMNYQAEAPTDALGSSSVVEQFSFPPLSELDFPDFPDARSGDQSSDREASRYSQVLSQSSSFLAKEESFPPLPGSSSRSTSAQQGLQKLAKDTLATRLQQRSKGSVKIVNSARAHPFRNPEDSASSSSSNPLNSWPEVHRQSSQPLHPSHNGVTQLAQSAVHNGFRAAASAQSTSTPNLADRSRSPPSAVVTAVPTVAAAGDVRAANKSLVEMIRTALGNDEERYGLFKGISAEYRNGQINTNEYLSYVEQFGLSHLVLELASLLPDTQRQRELVDAYKSIALARSLQRDGTADSGSRKDNSQRNKGKAKVSNAENSGSSGSSSSMNMSLEDSFLDRVRKLQVNQRPQTDVGIAGEVLTKDGYRRGNGNGNMQLPVSAQEPVVNSSGSDQGVDRKGGGKQKQKTSKFLRARLGDGSVSALLEIDRAQQDRLPSEEPPPPGLPARGAWRNGGGQRLFRE